MIWCKLVHGELHSWLDDSQFACSVCSSRVKGRRLFLQQKISQFYPASACEKSPTGNSIDRQEIFMGYLVEKTLWGESD